LSCPSEIRYMQPKTQTHISKQDSNRHKKKKRLTPSIYQFVNSYAVKNTIGVWQHENTCTLSHTAIHIMNIMCHRGQNRSECIAQSLAYTW
jgi:hypothetical protein